ncbi:unnamed protein product [Trichogramma brassicae]|uniref:Uncharacterized protein n=1 Tax=Trichogramma brassicae TaxID=86971 RepID=A0A6H5I568_9HYME|nr:unnamed protein product [Trichogramma brassicae]
MRARECKKEREPGQLNRDAEVPESSRESRLADPTWQWRRRLADKCMITAAVFTHTHTYTRRRAGQLFRSPVRYNINTAAARVYPGNAEISRSNCENRCTAAAAVAPPEWAVYKCTSNSMRMYIRIFAKREKNFVQREPSYTRLIATATAMASSRCNFAARDSHDIAQVRGPVRSWRPRTACLPACINRVEKFALSSCRETEEES